MSVVLFPVGGAEVSFPQEGTLAFRLWGDQR
jgi:hypothetical protein